MATDRSLRPKIRADVILGLFALPILVLAQECQPVTASSHDGNVPENVTIVRIVSKDPSGPAGQPPVIVSIEPPPGPVNVLTSITVQFDQPVTGVQADDLWINGVQAGSVEGTGAVYTWRFVQPPFGLVQIFWEGTHQIRDLNDPPSFFDTSSPDPAWEYDLINLATPAVTVLHPPPGITLRGLSELEVTFNKPVRGVDAADLLLNGMPASSLTVLDPDRYVFGFPEPASGTVSLDWATNHGITDRLEPPTAFAGDSWFYTLDPGLDYSGLRINEILASNRHGFLDEEGHAEDWIELLNASPQPLSLEGWSLTDDMDQPGQWTFPAVVLPPGEHLVVFASGKDRRSVNGSPLHANFRLALGGEYLGLYSADAPRLAVHEFSPRFPEQRTDYSYGFNSTGQLRYFAIPTPGAPNGDSLIHEIAEEPQFTVQRGLFDAPFELQLSTPTVDAAIRYTLDGSEPTSSTGTLYAGPLAITGTVAVRAVAFKPAALPSRPVTHTYIFPAQVLEQPTDPHGFPSTWGTGNNFPDNIVPAYYRMDPQIIHHPAYAPHAEDALRSLPSVSLVTDVEDMFGPQRGIYSHTAEGQTLYRGRLWERACSLEFIPPPGEDAFQVNAGVRIHGNASRSPAKTPKHSFRLFFRRDYGPSRLEQPVYPDSPATSFNTLVMRGDFNNSWLHWSPAQRQRGTRIRDGWAKESWRDMGHAGSHTRYFHLYINGLYWGVYDFGERIDAAFAANYHGGERADYDAMASKPTQAIDGDQLAYHAMISAVRFRDMTDLSNYLAAHEHLDVVNYIDYMLLNFYGGNEDWGFDSNWNAVRRREPGATYKYIPWDCEQLLANLNYNRVNNPSVPSGLHTNLVRSAEYRLAFADRVQKHLFHDGALSVPAVTQRWLKHADILEQAAITESARWGAYRRDVHPFQSGPYELHTRDDHWRTEIDRITHSYFPQRHAIFLQQLRNAGLYPSITAPQFSPHGGPFRDGTTIGIMAPSGVVYYTLDGSDPRVFGTGEISANAIASSGTAVLSSNTVIQARTWNNGQWSALTRARFELNAPAPYPLAEAGPYHFQQWNQDEPAGTYPPHILFYQTPVRDPGLAADMDSLWTLSYNLASRSRVNGLGADGFSFLNTANAQEIEGAGFLGAAVLALDTSGTADIRVTWTGGTVTPNSRVYGIRLQHRIGDEGPFTDLLEANGSPVEYIRDSQAGHSQVIGPVQLPDAVNDQPIVELRWLYYHISGDSGPRPQLSVAAVQVSGALPPERSLVIERVTWTGTGLELFIRGGYPGLRWQAGRSVDLMAWSWLWTGTIEDDSGWTVRDDSGEVLKAAFYQIRLVPGD